MNAALLFTRDHYLAAADTCMRGLERTSQSWFKPLRPFSGVLSVAETSASRHAGSIVGDVDPIESRRLMTASRVPAEFGKAGFEVDALAAQFKLREPRHSTTPGTTP